MTDTKKMLGYIGAGLLVLSILFLYVIPYYDDGYSKVRMFNFETEYGGIYFALIYILLIIGAITFVALDRLQYATWFTIAASSMGISTCNFAYILTLDDENYKMGLLLLMVLIEVSAAMVMIMTQTNLIGESGSISSKANTSVNSIDKTVNATTSERMHVTANPLNTSTSQQPTAISDEKLLELRKYKSLLEANAITQEQFDSLKKQILGL